MLVAALMLHIIIYDYDTGNVLYNYWQQTELTRRECIALGVYKATPLVEELRKTIPNASANVTCKPI